MVDTRVRMFREGSPTHKKCPTNLIVTKLQVKFHSFAKLLFFLRPTPEERLLVLGCGAGNSVMASALLYRWHQIQGMDLMQARAMPRMRDASAWYASALI